MMPHGNSLFNMLMYRIIRFKNKEKE